MQTVVRRLGLTLNSKHRQFCDPKVLVMSTDASASGGQPANPPYELIDIGANLTHRAFNNKELENVIDRAKASGVVKIMVTGTSIHGSEESLRLSRLYPNYLYSTAGIHPHDAKTWTEDSLRELERLAREPECVAIGECGLDFNRNFSTPQEQIKAFEAQVQLACRLKKPLFVHERDASTKMIEILGRHKEELPSTVIHCFTGTVDEALTYLNHGLYIGLTGFLWKDKLPNGVQKGLQSGELPLTRLMLETDAPFMYPKISAKKLPKEIVDSISDHANGFLQKYCNFKRNEPCALPAIAELIGGFAKVPGTEVAFNTTMNALKVFPGLSD